MKKILTLLILAALVLSGVFASCSKDEPEMLGEEVFGTTNGDGDGDGNGDGDEQKQENEPEPEPEPDPDPEPEPEPDPDPEPEPEPDDLDPPSIVWESNPDFDTVTLAAEMDVDITIEAPAGIDYFYAAIDCSSTLVASVLSSSFGIEAGKDYDIITDETLISLLSRYNVPCGSELKGATCVDFELSELAVYLYNYYNNLSWLEKLLVTGSVYVDMKVIDIYERSATARATLKFP